MNRYLARKMAAEAIGTFTLVFSGCGAIMAHTLHPAAISADAIPLVFGLIVAAMIYATGHISGAHMNPAVTFAFAVVKRFAWKELPFYWLAQMLGAFAAVAVLALTLPPAAHYGATLPTLAPAYAFAWEALLTFFLMFVIIAVATDSRAVGVMAGAAIGATVMCDAFIGGAFTGASMNPARSLAPAWFAQKMEYGWVYVFGPLCGATLAAWAYELIRCDDTPDQEKLQAKGCC